MYVWDCYELRKAGIKIKDRHKFHERLMKVAESLQISVETFRYPEKLFYSMKWIYLDYINPPKFIKVTYLDQIQYIRYEIDQQGQLESVKYVTATPLQTLIFQEE